MANFAKTVLVDTGFWYALYTEDDQFHTDAQQKGYLLESTNVLIPWPSLYETFNSKLAKNKIALRSFEHLLRQTHITLLPDEPYRNAALEASLEMALIRSRNIALVDMVIRLILEDNNVRKHGLLTFDPKDFSDVCRQYHIEML